MRALRYAALVPGAVGVIFLFFVAVVWTAWPQLVVGVVLVDLAAIWWWGAGRIARRLEDETA